MGLVYGCDFSEHDSFFRIDYSKLSGKSPLVPWKYRGLHTSDTSKKERSHGLVLSHSSESKNNRYERTLKEFRKHCCKDVFDTSKSSKHVRFVDNELLQWLLRVPQNNT
jgi:hypothetical protein